MKTRAGNGSKEVIVVCVCADNVLFCINYFHKYGIASDGQRAAIVVCEMLHLLAWNLHFLFLLCLYLFSWEVVSQVML